MEIGCKCKGLASMPWDFAHKRASFLNRQHFIGGKDEKWFDGFFTGADDIF